MQSRHPVYEEPAEPENPPSPAEAEANVLAGLDPAWVRRFNTHVDNDGATIYVDTATGQTYSELPAMHSKDGADT